MVGGDGKMHHYSRVKSTQISFFDEICEGGKKTGRTGHTAQKSPRCVVQGHVLDDAFPQK